MKWIGEPVLRSISVNAFKCQFPAVTFA